MRTEVRTHLQALRRLQHQRGVTLIETIVFIVVVSIGLGALLMVFNHSVVKSVDPVIRVKALEKGQALMDEILARKFAENSPTGGIPACDSAAGDICTAIGSDADYDDVGDYNGYTDNSDVRFPVSVTVQDAGAELGIAGAQARRITLRVGMPDGNSLTLSAYKVNF